MDFLLSLSAKAKEKLSKAKLPENTNKSVIYADQALSEDEVSNISLITMTMIHNPQLSSLRIKLILFTTWTILIHRRQNGLLT